jgi:hypothetical protein
MTDPHAAGRAAIHQAVLKGPGHTPSGLREAAAKRSGDLPAELRALVDKVHQHAYEVTAEEIAELQKKYSDDELFEVIVAAALGASGERLDAALRALDEASR